MEDILALGLDRDLNFSRVRQGYEPPSSVTTPHIFDSPQTPPNPPKIYKSTDFSALGHDRDLGFSRGHQGHQGHQPHDDDNNEKDDDKEDDNNKDNNND